MSIYEEVEIEDLIYDPEELLYTYPCPCGDNFRITLEDLWDGEDIALCPSCTLRIMIIYDEDDLPPLPDESDFETDDEDDKDGNEVEEEEKGDSSVDKDLANSVQKSLAVK